ncbi:hypothetical protein SKAU_G00335960 [Synaphobranchus kaupii]|uniref:Uncharacterized protein n=1 Tax=Synaphobranchus kaupii TaxID=118154 RepID=A0A9Q1EM80_SYNKA|nr:hypothetical protein SKAU_G00335960 [Synaphobranchus kaupii]
MYPTQDTRTKGFPISVRALEGLPGDRSRLATCPPPRRILGFQDVMVFGSAAHQRAAAAAPGAPRGADGASLIAGNRTATKLLL